MNVQNVERLLKFVRHFHTPIALRCQLPVNALKYLPGRYRGLFPRGVLVRKFLAFAVDFGTLMRSVEKVFRHAGTVKCVSGGS